MTTLKRLLLAASVCCLVATANAAPMDDINAAYDRGDYAQANKLARSLAVQGNAQGQYTLGVLYMNGQGVTQNYQEAIKWLRLAASQGELNAQVNLGVMYQTS